jgi:hypothetical protein
MSTLVSDEGAGKASVTGHYRVAKDVYDSLEAEAHAHGMSLNALVGSILARHAREDWIYEEVEYVRMPKELARMHFGRMSDDELVKSGEFVATHIQNTLLVARDGGITLDAVLNELRHMAEEGWFSIHEDRTNGRRTVTLVHNLGRGYSIASKASNMALFGLVGVHPDITITDSLIKIEY